MATYKHVKLQWRFTGSVPKQEVFTSDSPLPELYEGAKKTINEYKIVSPDGVIAVYRDHIPFGKVFKRVGWYEVVEEKPKEEPKIVAPF